MNTLGGVIPILATPFRPDESLDLVSWRRLLERMAALGVDGVTVTGVLGEANRLNDFERETLIAAAVETVAGRFPVIAGVSAGGTAATAHLARRAAALGADAAMIAPGREAVPNETRIVESFCRVADSTSLPIVLQDHPASTEVHLAVETIRRIVEQVPTVACIKEEAVPTAPKLRQLRDCLPRPVPILTGLGALYAPFDLAAGADGFNTGFAFPEVLQAMWRATVAGDAARVAALYARYAALIVYEQQPGVAVRKAILQRRGWIDSATVRHPGAALSPEAARQLETLLTATFGDADLTQAIAP